MNSPITMEEPDVLDAEEPAQHPAPATLPPHALAQPAQQATPAVLLQMAVQQGADLAQLERLMALQERWEANEARKAYSQAIADFKKNPPTIVKDKHVSFRTKAGVTAYDHATLGNVVREVIAGLAKHGISHSWVPSHLSNNRVAVTCVLTHSKGHSEQVTLQGEHDDSGGKNAIQAMASAVTYLERYTLLAITGLATEDQDDDAQGAALMEEATGQASERIANQILDQLLLDLQSTDTDAKAAALWASGSKSLYATGSMQSYEEFKSAVVAHRNLLKKQNEVTA